MAKDNIENKVDKTFYQRHPILAKTGLTLAAITTLSAPVYSGQTLLNKTGARPLDYDKKVWMGENWGAHLGDSYNKLKGSFSSPKKYISAPFNLVNLVLVGANETVEGALNLATSPFWGAEEKLRDLDGEKGGTRKFIRYITDSLPGGRTFDTSVRRTFNFNYVGENKDKVYETFPASLVTNLLAGDYRATWDPEHKVFSIATGTFKTVVRAGSIALPFSGNKGTNSSSSSSSSTTTTTSSPSPHGQ